MDYKDIQQRENKCWRAKDSNGKIVTIDDVHHGSFAYCRCYCLHCGKPVNAEKNAYPKHFSHANWQDAVACYAKPT